MRGKCNGAQALNRRHGIALCAIGRGALISQRSRIVKFCGALSSENAGISNLKRGENPLGRKSKVSRATVMVPGLVGPKPRRMCVGDGQQVNIPVQVKVVQISQNVTRAV